MWIVAGTLLFFLGLGCIFLSQLVESSDKEFLEWYRERGPDMGTAFMTIGSLVLWILMDSGSNRASFFFY